MQLPCYCPLIHCTEGGGQGEGGKEDVSTLHMRFQISSFDSELCIKVPRPPGEWTQSETVGIVRAALATIL